MPFKYDIEDIGQGSTCNHGLDEGSRLGCIVPEQIHENGHFQNAHGLADNIDETGANGNEKVDEGRVPLDGKHGLVLAGELFSAVEHEWAVNIFIASYHL